MFIEENFDTRIMPHPRWHLAKTIEQHRYQNESFELIMLGLKWIHSVSDLLGNGHKIGTIDKTAS